MFQFGAFEFDEATGGLRKHGTHVKLQPQPSRLLQLLLQNAGEIVKRDQIQQSVWGTDIVVDYELGVNRCIRQLRSALLDDATAPRYIKTFPRVGYSFVAPLRTVSAQLPEKTTGPDAEVRQLWSVPLLAAIALAFGLLGTVWWWIAAHQQGIGRDIEPLPLTGYPGIEFSPVFSPDGRPSLGTHGLGEILGPFHLGVFYRTMESRDVSRVLRYRYVLDIQVQVQQGKHSVRSGPKHDVPSSCRASAHERTFFNPVTKPFALLAGRAHKTTIAEKTRLREVHNSVV